MGISVANAGCSSHVDGKPVGGHFPRPRGYGGVVGCFACQCPQPSPPGRRAWWDRLPPGDIDGTSSREPILLLPPKIDEDCHHRRIVSLQRRPIVVTGSPPRRSVPGSKMRGFTRVYLRASLQSWPALLLYALLAQDGSAAVAKCCYFPLDQRLWSLGSESIWLTRAYITVQCPPCAWVGKELLRHSYSM